MSGIVVVRHGRTTANARGLLLGRADPELDDLGRRQAAATAREVLRTAGPVTAVVSSPLRRTVATAEAFGVPVTVDERFVELDYGDWDGLPVAEVAPEVWASWRADPDFAPPAGESLAHLDARVRAACEELVPAARSGTVVVVTHVSPLKAALTWALGVDGRTSWRTRVDPGSITRIAVAGAVPVLCSFNETGHLAGC